VKNSSSIGIESRSRNDLFQAFQPFFHVHEHVSGDFLGSNVLEIEGGVSLNEIVIISEVVMNDGVGIGAMLDARNEVFQDAGFEGGRPLGEACGFIKIEPRLRGNEIPKTIDRKIHPW